MNNILVLNGGISSRKAQGSMMFPSLPSGSLGVDDKKFDKLISDLHQVLQFWEKDEVLDGALVSVYHTRIIAKSNRLKALLKEAGKSINETIKGARYTYETLQNGMHKPKHVFTYFISINTLKNTIELLNKCRDIIKSKYSGLIRQEDIDVINKNKTFDNPYGLKKSTFVNAIIDANNVEKFFLDMVDSKDYKKDSLITFYETNINYYKFLEESNIDNLLTKRVDDYTYFLSKSDIDTVIQKAPYLIAMSLEDISKIPPLAKKDLKKIEATIPRPNGEPVIGVIDTLFDDRVYFHEWVEYKCMVDKRIEIVNEDYEHGTCVSSIIVDGPSFNKDMEDNCGRFRVRHFGVSKAEKFSSRSIVKSIKQAVVENLDIKVWNISLGSEEEVNENFISIEGAELDKIQTEYDVIFIISGTNKTKSEKRIGAPADSINSIVVNSVNFNQEPASYTRSGPVLSFFCKPDVSYYGGDDDKYIRVCSPTGEAFVRGTSFAAPWITRKVAYMIYKLELSKEVAKALIIDSAAGWRSKSDNIYKSGYGIVPIDINDIVHSPDDEIKFILKGEINEYETYSYGLPVPKENDKQPFYAKATLVYSPYCNRNQGVGYTLTELDMHFGRMKGERKIAAINNNMQTEDGEFLYEEEARKMFRKWDNVKHIMDELKTRPKPRKVYGSGEWGISLKCKERLDKKNGKDMKYGIVVTLKEMNGKNRLDDFKNLCIARGWVVSELNVENQISILNKLEQDIDVE